MSHERERCVVCDRDEPPATPASGKGANKAWLCGSCQARRTSYLAQNDGTVLDSIAWAARTARAKALEEAAYLLEKGARQCRETSRVNEESLNPNIDAQWHERLQRAAKVYDDAAMEIRALATKESS